MPLLPSSSALLRLCLGFFIALLPGAASAQHVLLWGVTRGCELDKEASRLVKDTLESATFTTTTITGAIPGLSPTEAGSRLRAACPSTQGLLLGGMVEAESPEPQRFRLWLHDLASGQTAYLDDWCKRGCKLGERMGQQAIGLVDKPRYAAASQQPGYCIPDPEASVVKPRSQRVIVMIYGESKHRAATWNALKKSLSVQGRDPVQWQGEAKIGYGALKKMTKADPSGQVLGIELSSDGADLWVYDAIKGQSYPAKFDCKDCTRDELADKLAFRAGSLLDEAAQPEATRSPPEAACTPFAFAQCGGAANLSSAGIDPKLATTLTALTWGAFAVTAAASVGLFAANSSAAGVQKGQFDEAQNSLVRPAWALAGASALMLGVAIPVHLLVSRAQNRTLGGQPTVDGKSLQCPN